MQEQPNDEMAATAADSEGAARGLTVHPEELALFAPGLAKIRRRRWFLWSVIILYLPTMWTTQQITRSFRGSLPVFFAWCLLLLAAMAFSAAVRCPRCRNYYHVHGLTLLYLRRCLHCQLPLTADRTGTPPVN